MQSIFPLKASGSLVVCARAAFGKLPRTATGYECPLFCSSDVCPPLPFSLREQGSKSWFHWPCFTSFLRMLTSVPQLRGGLASEGQVTSCAREVLASRIVTRVLPRSLLTPILRPSRGQDGFIVERRCDERVLNHSPCLSNETEAHSISFNFHLCAAADTEFAGRSRDF